MVSGTMAAVSSNAGRSFASTRWGGRPPVCAFNPSCTVLMVATVVGARAFEIREAAAALGGATIRSLLPCETSSNAFTATNASPLPPCSTAPKVSSLSALWQTPVYTATVVGDTALVAVVFRTRPRVFVPSTVRMGSAETYRAATAAATDATVSTGDESLGGTSHGSTDTPGTEDPFFGFVETTTDPVGDLTFSPLEAECRRYVYLFDAAHSGTCLAALYFCGSPVLALRANTSVLLVVAQDLFHLVDLRTLRYLGQHSMYKPLNPHGIVDLSAAIPSKRSGGVFYAVAFPQSARGFRGDATVLTLHSATPSSLPTAHVRDKGPLSETGTANAAASSAKATNLPPPRSPSPPMLQRTIPAHRHAIAHLKLRADGRLLATASELGTTVKLFDCSTGALLTELQRGHRPAAILSLAVQDDAHRIAALSANGTLHVFDCAAVVQSWEASTSSPLQASPNRSLRFTALTTGAVAGKVRAVCKLKVPLLFRGDSSDSTSLKMTPRATTGGSEGEAVCRKWTSSQPSNTSFPPMDVNGSAVKDEWVQYEAGFSSDGHAVWVAQVQSGEAQTLGLLELRNLNRKNLRPPSPSPARSHGLCVGHLVRFPLTLPGHSSAIGTVPVSEAREERGCFILV